MTPSFYTSTVGKFNIQIASLKKKISKCKDVVSELVEAIFKPKLIFEFNLNGYNKLSFKRTRINDIFFGMLAVATIMFNKYNGMLLIYTVFQI